MKFEDLDVGAVFTCKHDSCSGIRIKLNDEASHNCFNFADRQQTTEAYMHDVILHYYIKNFPAINECQYLATSGVLSQPRHIGDVYIRRGMFYMWFNGVWNHICGAMVSDTPSDDYCPGSDYGVPKIKDVIFHDPATIVFWKDGTKTVVKKQKGDKYDKEKGLALCIAKKAMGNNYGYFNVFKKWIKS